MADRKEVIKALELCEPDGPCHPNDCPYFTKPSCLERLREDVLELLKEQELKEPTQEAQRDYEAASDVRDYCERYEPTYNSDDSSM